MQSYVDGYWEEVEAITEEKANYEKHFRTLLFWLMFGLTFFIFWYLIPTAFNAVNA